ncbi:MAG: hypothetical protein EBR86_16795 [Planctomycetia bacterium]|nr:hypothetical protein [Planctomycetia bacterium]
MRFQRYKFTTQTLRRTLGAVVAIVSLSDVALGQSYIPFDYPQAAGGSTFLTGVRGVAGGPSDQVYISGVFKPSGTSATQGLMYQGSINANTGAWYTLNYPGAGGETITSTALYGPNNLGTGVRVVGSYKTSSSNADIGVMYEGPVNGVGGTWTSLSFPGSIDTIAHSTYGDLVVGNYDTQLDNGKGFVYSVSENSFRTLEFNGITPTSWTAYGIVQNQNGSYTIAGGFSLAPSVTGLDEGYIVDYDPLTHSTSHFHAYNYGGHPVTSVISHFNGITSDGHGGYNLTGDWVGAGSAGNGLGFFAHVDRAVDGGFSDATWTSIAYPAQNIGPTSGNTVYENYVLGVYFDSGGPGGPTQGYIATVNVPEIDPAGMGSVLALVTGALGLLERRRLKVKLA